MELEAEGERVRSQRVDGSGVDRGFGGRLHLQDFRCRCLEKARAEDFIVATCFFNRFHTEHEEPKE